MRGWNGGKGRGVCGVFRAGGVEVRLEVWRGGGGVRGKGAGEDGGKRGEKGAGRIAILLLQKL